MSWDNSPKVAPVPRPTWRDPDCSCGKGHRPHEGHCPQAGCSCYREPPTCSVCMHRDHGAGNDCFALGVRDPCICKGPGHTTRQELEDHAFSAEGRNRR